MSFEHARVLGVAAVIVPLLALFLWGTWRKRQALIRQFVQHKLLAQLSLGTSAGRHKLRRVLLVFAVTFLLLAIARPQWGFVWEEASQRGRDIIVAMDASRSMLAEDVQPNRLARAKLAALDLLKLGQYDRFGLVAFAGTAFLQCPLTFDEEAFRQSVEILEPGILPQGGTAIGGAIESAIEAFGKDADDNHKVIVLFTDGEDHEEGVMEIVQRAAESGVRIFTVGAGTPAGEVLRVRDERGNSGFIKDAAGNVVKSRLNEELLRKIATAARAFYLPLNAAHAMEVLYKKGLAPLPTSERATKLMKRLNEQFYWPLALAIILLIIEIMIPEQKRAPKRRREPQGLATAAVLLLLFAFLPGAQATPATALRKYKNREFKGALSEYQKLIEKNPNDPRLQYNAGASAFQANKWDEALDRFQAAAASPDLDLQQQAYYNLGNTEFKLGESNSDPKERMASWEHAVQHYEAALRLNSADPDAAFNRDLVKRKLEELKQQEQKPDQGDQKAKDDEKKDDQEKKGDEQKDKKDQEQKQDQQKEEKQDEQKQPEKREQQDPSEKEKQQQQQDAQDKKDQAEPSQEQKPGGQKNSGEDQPKEGEEGQSAQLGKMTPAQAKQLLDAQRSEEKALMFIPKQKQAAPKDRIFKDW